MPLKTLFFFKYLEWHHLKGLKRFARSYELERVVASKPVSEISFSNHGQECAMHTRTDMFFVMS